MIGDFKNALESYTKAERDSPNGDHGPSNGKGAIYEELGEFEKALESEGWNASKSGYYVRKFTKEKVDVFLDPPTEEIMWVVYRLSEFYLNEAEILNELGTTDPNGNDAAWYVNQIRQRNGLNMPAHLSVDGAKIRHGRCIELCFEGNSYYDVRRWQIYDQALGNPQMGDYHRKTREWNKKLYGF